MRFINPSQTASIIINFVTCHEIHRKRESERHTFNDKVRSYFRDTRECYYHLYIYPNINSPYTWHSPPIVFSLFFSPRGIIIWDSVQWAVGCIIIINQRSRLWMYKLWVFIKFSSHSRYNPQHTQLIQIAKNRRTIRHSRSSESTV